MDRKRAVCPRGGLAAVLILLCIAGLITPAGGQENKPEHDSAATVADLLRELELPASAANLPRRRDAARRLSEMHPLPAEAIAPLTKALDTWDRGGVQRYAMIALAGAGARAIPALASQCGHYGRDGEGCQAAIETLGKIAPGEPAAWPVLIDDFRSGYPGGAAVAIGEVGAPAVPPLRRALKSDDPETRAMAAKALSDIGPPAKAAIPDLIPLLNDPARRPGPSGEWPSPVVQYAAAIALANIDPTRKEALPVLEKILMSERWMTGIDAIKAVEKMGANAHEAVPVLEHIISSEPDNRSLAVEALAKIEGCAAGPVLARTLKNDKDANVRFHAARALAELGADCPATIPALAEALNNGDSDAASELARLGKPGLAAMTPALRNPDLDVRKSVVDALTNLAIAAPWVSIEGEQVKPLADELVRPLMIAMRDKSITIREQAATALQSAGGEPARLAAAELDRERAIDAKESALDPTPRTRAQIAASIPPDADHKYPLALEYLYPIYESVAVEEPEYLISLYRGRERADRLVFWKRAGAGKYEQAKVMESSDVDLSGGRFLPPKVFRAQVTVLGEGRPFSEGRQFVDVPQQGCNTWCLIDNVFVIGSGDFIPVQIESPEEWYKSKLKPGESTWHSNRNFFSDDELSFAFGIWAREDPHASPSGGEVTGKYKIVKDRHAPSAGGMVAYLGAPPVFFCNPAANNGGCHPTTTWKMVVDTAERKPVASR